ncbi:hypothetical protein [Vibrio sp. D431a]|uniref:hypothetical protein n=1 Tax=Vibrio sp. D431a TaxID=2837388 RepID=UPI0025532780|nr:hypothetical protein [Vibrio sp. D431a]MDK9790040.1 hypothetical protein [Vibrio sp. D431a]
MIVYLKSIDGTKKRFDSLKDLFVYLENKPPYYGRYNRCYSVHTLIGDSFTSSAKPIGSGFEDTRNQVCSFSIRKSLGYDCGKSYVRSDVWLATGNKYIVLDDKGRVISKELVLARYQQRWDALVRTKGLARRIGTGISTTVPTTGYKFDKNSRKRLRKLYRATSFNGNEARAFDSRDEYDMTFPPRAKRRDIVKCLWMRDYDYYNERFVSKSWKQSKKRRQWM